MQERVKACLEKIELEEKEQAAAYRKKVLIEMGLCEKKFELSNEERADYSAVHMDQESGRYFVYEPIVLSEEEWIAVEAAYKKQNTFQDASSGSQIEVNSKNGVATMLTVIAVITYVFGFIGGIITAGTLYGFNYTIMITYWVVTFVSGTMLLGFSQIIKLLQAIKSGIQATTK